MEVMRRGLGGGCNEDVRDVDPVLEESKRYEKNICFVAGSERWR